MALPNTSAEQGSVDRLTCAIMISTRNRRADLERTCAVLAQLDPPPWEVLLCADGCTDGTIDFLRQHYPGFRLLIHEPAQGSIASRDAMMRASTADLVLSLDDDSYPLDTDFLQHAASLFARSPHLGVADFPQLSDEDAEWLSSAEASVAQRRGSYSSASAVVRRSSYLELGGYPPFFFHAYEEPDFAARCVAAGYEVRFVPGKLIRHHYTGVQRNEMRTHHLHARNEFWSVLLRCPWPYWPAVALFRAARQFGYARKRGLAWVVREPVWWWRALKGIWLCLRHRQPLPWACYLRWMKLIRSPKAIDTSA